MKILDLVDIKKHILLQTLALLYLDFSFLLLLFFIFLLILIYQIVIDYVNINYTTMYYNLRLGSDCNLGKDLSKR